MKALSIKQPWASLICTPREDNPALGIKDIENRTWKTNFRGKIYVHASQAWNAAIAEICISNPNVKAALEKLGKIHNYKDKSIGYKGYSFSGLEHGAIIGEVDIIDCVINHDSIWAEKAQQQYRIYDNTTVPQDVPKHIYNWVLANPLVYEKPIPAKGKLSFWEPDIFITECIGCDGKFDLDLMEQDDAGENYCPECWAELAPIMKAEYNEMKAKVEIE